MATWHFAIFPLAMNEHCMRSESCGPFSFFSQKTTSFCSQHSGTIRKKELMGGGGVPESFAHGVQHPSMLDTSATWLFCTQPISRVWAWLFQPPFLSENIQKQMFPMLQPQTATRCHSSKMLRNCPIVQFCAFEKTRNTNGVLFWTP